MKSGDIQNQLRSMLLALDYYVNGQSSLYQISQSLGDSYLSIERNESTKDFLDKFHGLWSALEQIVADDCEDRYKNEILNRYIPDLRSLIQDFLIEK